MKEDEDYCQGPDGEGLATITLEVGQKWLQLLHDIVPTANTFALLINPTSRVLAEAQSQDLGEAARTLGLQLQVLRASTDSELNGAFATFAQSRSGGLVISSDAFFLTQTAQLAALAARHAVPAIFGFPGFPAAGGLMSYGSDTDDAYRQVGTYTGLATRILFDGTRARGIEYLQNGERKLAQAEREVLLAAGVINSPHLLMLSGIGDPGELRAHSIGVRMSLPGVGKNLQDHISASVEYRRRDPGPNRCR